VRVYKRTRGENNTDIPSQSFNKAGVYKPRWLLLKSSNNPSQQTNIICIRNAALHRYSIDYEHVTKILHPINDHLMPHSIL